MAIKRSTGEKIFEVFNITFMLLLMCITLYPFLYIALASVSDPNLISGHSGLLLKPYGFHMESYMAVLKNRMIGLGYKNTLIYVTVGTAINIAITSMGAYTLSKKKVFWNKTIMTMVVITMFFGGGLIPNYLLILNLNMRNTIWAIVLPQAVSAWNLIIMRTSFMGIPESMEESAKLDGANDFVVFFRIIVPLSKAVIAVMILFYGVNNWNRWFEATIYLTDRNKYPLQVILREILIQNETKDMMQGITEERNNISKTIQYATIIVATLPIVCVYPFLQKYFVKGVMIGALKG